jgi:hypothetical protein
MYVYLPTDAAPGIVDAHPTDSRISDDLAGTFIQATVNGLCVHLREDAYRLPFNPAATYLLSVTVDRTFPAYGPVVITGIHSLIDVELNGIEVGVGGRMVDLDAERARIGASFGEEGYLAYHGSILDAGHVYTAKVREWLNLAEKLEIPKGWPGVADAAIRKAVAKAAADAAGGQPTSLGGPFYV